MCQVSGDSSYSIAHIEVQYLFLQALMASRLVKYNFLAIVLLQYLFGLFFWCTRDVSVHRSSVCCSMEHIAVRLSFL